MAPFFANQSCDPFQPRERPCEVGNYIRYAVDASGPADVQKAIAFAASNNIRLVIRNTGHGRLRVSGFIQQPIDPLRRLPGSLHGRRLPRSMDPPSQEYHSHTRIQGLRLQWSSIQGFEIMAAARDKGLVVVGGECPTVGIAGKISA